MKLLLAKPLTYISPSAFMTWKSCQFKIYQSRLAGHKYMDMKQSPAAAIGTAFDAFIKHCIASRTGKLQPHNHIDRLLTDLNCDNKGDIITKGKSIAKQYIDMGYVDKILGKYGDIDVECNRYSNFGGVPILGKIDMVVDNVPFDWKTRGWASNYPISPTKGYSHSSHNDRRHPEYGLPLNVINDRWAIQLTFYNWILGNDNPPIIHEIFPKRDGTVAVSIYDTIIQVGFVNQLRVELEEMWETIMGQGIYTDIKEPVPRKSLCEAYNSVCVVAHLCKKYKDTLGNPERRELYV